MPVFFGENATCIVPDVLLFSVYASIQNDFDFKIIRWETRKQGRFVQYAFQTLGGSKWYMQVL